MVARTDKGPMPADKPPHALHRSHLQLYLARSPAGWYALHPQRMDFSQTGPKEVPTYQTRINDRPRKKLNYSTAPADRPSENVKIILSTPIVAGQT
jgi:hypothetical protein